MFCCILKLTCLEEKIQGSIIQRFKTTLETCFDSGDRIAILDREMVLICTYIEAYRIVEEKLIGIWSCVKNQYGISVKLTAGFAEIKNGNIANAMDAAKQMLARTENSHPILGMYYYTYSKM